MTDAATHREQGPAVSTPSTRRLWRSRQDRVIGGVCGGLGRYLDVDPVLLRVATVALALSGGAGVIVYLVAWIAVPLAPIGGAQPPATTGRSRSTAAVTAGAVLIVIGGLLMLRAVLPWWEWPWVWPSLLLATGALMLASAWRR